MPKKANVEKGPVNELKDSFKIEVREKKNYFVDTNVVLDDPRALKKLRNGHENNTYLPFHVLLELNRFKKEPLIGYLVREIINYLLGNPDDYILLEPKGIKSPDMLSSVFSDLVDLYILNEIKESGIEDPIFVTNDKILTVIAEKQGIKCEPYRDSVPFKNPAEYNTGIYKDKDKLTVNSFLWDHKGIPIFHGRKDKRALSYSHEIWKVKPRNIYQNMAMDLLINPDIYITSLQSKAGFGKSYLALAAAFYLVFEKKQYKKIIVVKPTVEIGESLGYLPGDVGEKMAPHIAPGVSQALKLHNLRPANKVFIDPKAYPPVHNPRFFEIQPLQFVRGMNFEDSVVIVEEPQNMTRIEGRALFTRMAENVKCFCVGSVDQVDVVSRHTSPENNALNWLVKKLSPHKNYAHFVLQGKKSRGPITDMINESGY